MSLPPVIILKMLWKVLWRWFCSRRDGWRSVLRVDLQVDVPGLKLQAQYRRHKQHKSFKPRGKDRRQEKPGKL